jgi:S1-C subfamily serine protease
MARPFGLSDKDYMSNRADFHRRSSNLPPSRPSDQSSMRWSRGKISVPRRRALCRSYSANCRPCARFSPDKYSLGVEVLYNPNPRQALVSGVHWPSPAFDAGLRMGDSILIINDKGIASASREVSGKPLGPESAFTTTFQVSRLRRKKTITIKPATFRSAWHNWGPAQHSRRRRIPIPAKLSTPD